MVTPATHQPKSDRQNGNWKIHKRKRKEEAMIILIFFFQASPFKRQQKCWTELFSRWQTMRRSLWPKTKKSGNKVILLHQESLSDMKRNDDRGKFGVLPVGNRSRFLGEFFDCPGSGEESGFAGCEGLAPHHNQQHCRVFFPMMMMMVAIDILWGTLHLGCHHHAVVYNVRRGPSHWWVWVGYMYSRLSKPSIT